MRDQKKGHNRTAVGESTMLRGSAPHSPGVRVLRWRSNTDPWGLITFTPYIAHKRKRDPELIARLDAEWAADSPGEETTVPDDKYIDRLRAALRGEL
jgi:hypothetical protein